MTTVDIISDKQGTYKSIIFMGHAGYAKNGEPDIVCAAISILMESTMNALEELAGEKIKATLNEETGFAKFDFAEDVPLQEKSVFMLDSFVLALENLSRKCGTEYLQVNFKEV